MVANFRDDESDEDLQGHGTHVAGTSTRERKPHPSFYMIRFDLTFI